MTVDGEVRSDVPNRASLGLCILEREELYFHRSCCQFCPQLWPVMTALENPTAAV